MALRHTVLQVFYLRGLGCFFVAPAEGIVRGPCSWSISDDAGKLEFVGQRAKQ